MNNSFLKFLNEDEGFHQLYSDLNLADFINPSWSTKLKIPSTEYQTTLVKFWHEGKLYDLRNEFNLHDQSLPWLEIKSEINDEKETAIDSFVKDAQAIEKYLKDNGKSTTDLPVSAYFDDNPSQVFAKLLRGIYVGKLLILFESKPGENTSAKGKNLFSLIEPGLKIINNVHQYGLKDASKPANVYGDLSNNSILQCFDFLSKLLGIDELSTYVKNGKVLENVLNIRIKQFEALLYLYTGLSKRNEIQQMVSKLKSFLTANPNAIEPEKPALPHNDTSAEKPDSSEKNDDETASDTEPEDVEFEIKKPSQTGDQTADTSNTASTDVNATAQTSDEPEDVEFEIKPKKPEQAQPPKETPPEPPKETPSEPSKSEKPAEPEKPQDSKIIFVNKPEISMPTSEYAVIYSVDSLADIEKFFNQTLNDAGRSAVREFLKKTGSNDVMQIAYVKSQAGQPVLTPDGAVDKSKLYNQVIHQVGGPGSWQIFRSNTSMLYKFTKSSNVSIWAANNVRPDLINTIRTASANKWVPKLYTEQNVLKKQKHAFQIWPSNGTAVAAAPVTSTATAPAAAQTSGTPTAAGASNGTSNQASPAINQSVRTKKIEFVYQKLKDQIDRIKEFAGADTYHFKVYTTLQSNIYYQKPKTKVLLKKGTQLTSDSLLKTIAENYDNLSIHVTYGSLPPNGGNITEWIYHMLVLNKLNDISIAVTDPKNSNDSNLQKQLDSKLKQVLSEDLDGLIFQIVPPGAYPKYNVATFKQGANWKSSENFTFVLMMYGVNETVYWDQDALTYCKKLDIDDEIAKILNELKKLTPNLQFAVVQDNAF